MFVCDVFTIIGILGTLFEVREKLNKIDIYLVKCSVVQFLLIYSTNQLATFCQKKKLNL